jgi:hypothetical protein
MIDYNSLIICWGEHESLDILEIFINMTDYNENIKFLLNL